MSIALTFFIISSLLLWIVIGSKGHWGLKAVTIAFVLYFCLSINLSLSNLLGWPSDQSLPEEFQVHWIEIKEPNKRTGDKGCVYVWATGSEGEHHKTDGWRTLLVYFQNYDPTEPRAYRLNYSRELHERSQEALGKIKNGEGVGGKNNGRGKGKGEGEGDGKGKGKGNGDGKNGQAGGGSLSNSDDIIFHNLPPSKLPDKVTGE